MFTEGIFPIGDGMLDIDEERLKGLLVQDDINEIYDVEQTPFARGKFAAVRRAVHKSSGVHFAAKFLKRRRRAQSSDKEIKHEIAVLMLCDGAENIVKLNAVHESRSDTALLLELATGGELQTFLDNEECLSETQARTCMREVLKALQFLHNRSIAHLDLKPQNILLAGEHIEDGLKLCDFGISRVVAEGTNVREIVGTPDYVAPEVLQYEPLSLLTDIWSVGVLTYVLLSGFSPFGGETKQETFLNISQCALTFPEKLFGGVSAPAIDFIRRALRIKPSDRMTAAGCLEHIWLKDECAIDRQIFNNISKTTTADDDDDDDDDDGVEEDDNDDDEHDESFEEDLAELIEDEEQEIEENVINGHKMDLSDTELPNELATTINTISNGKIEISKNSNKALTMKSAIYSASNGSTKTKTTALITVPTTRATTTLLSNNSATTSSSTTAQHQQILHVAARRHSSDANKENTYVAIKKIAPNSATPPPIAKKPTLTTTATATIVVTPTTTSAAAAAANQVVSSITIPTVATADKHINNAAVCCIFPDAPTTPKVIRKAPATDNSPTSVKALVKKFQLEGSSSNASSRATSPAPAASAAATSTVHLKESSQQNQMHIISNTRSCSAAVGQRRASTNTININGSSRENERTTTATSRKSTTSLPNDMSAFVHQKSSLSASSSLKKSAQPTATATTTVSVTNGSNGSSYKTTCVFCLTCSESSNNTANSSTNGCRHSLAGSKAIVSHTNSGSSSSSSNNSATSTAAAILLSNHKQLQHHHHHHVHHAVHHVQKSAANNLSLDQGIIC